MPFTVSYCGGCKVPCCNRYHGFRPVLMPWEDGKNLFGLVEELGKLTLIKQKANGECIFFKAGRCAVYERRPFECQIYPFILDLSKGVTLLLDAHANCSKFVLEAEGRDLLRSYADKEIPHAWASAYSHYTAARKEKGRGHEGTPV